VIKLDDVTGTPSVDKSNVVTPSGNSSVIVTPVEQTLKPNDTEGLHSFSAANHTTTTTTKWNMNFTDSSTGQQLTLSIPFHVTVDIFVSIT